jgi:hypothetical protein
MAESKLVFPLVMYWKNDLGDTPQPAAIAGLGLCACLLCAQPPLPRSHKLTALILDRPVQATK